MSIRNVLFVMADQPRLDHLSCYGHPHLSTPTVDGLAARGVRFDNASLDVDAQGRSGARARDLPKPVGCIERGEIRPLLAASYPLEWIVDAQRVFRDKRQAGKIVSIFPNRRDDSARGGSVNGE